MMIMMVAVIIMMIIMINIDIFTNGLIDIDMFKNHAININIFKKCRYDDNQYFLLIYISNTPGRGGSKAVWNFAMVSSRLLSWLHALGFQCSPMGKFQQPEAEAV